MEIKKYYLTKNKCYTNGTIINPIGFMLHSTGANNPTLKRYIQPDDGIIGYNKNGNDWNNDIIRVMVHGFIGKDKNGVVRAYQTLPYNYKAWHCGGSGNTTHVSWEMCEDDLNSKDYFDEVYNLAVYVATQFCIENNLTESCIIDHSDGYKTGIASNHGDVKHWFSKFGKTMDDFRAEVKKQLEGDKVGNNKETTFTLDQFEEMFNEMIKRKQLESSSTWADDFRKWNIENKISDGTKPRMYVERQESWAMNKNLYDRIIAKVNEIVGK